MRNSKVLGLALIAMLALSAMAATSASADEVTAEKYPATLTGVNESTFADQFLTTAGVVTCQRSTYTATIAGATTSVTVTPNYGDPHPTDPTNKHNCTTNSTRTIVDMNGCDYIVNVGAGTAGDVDLFCPLGQEVTLTVTPTGGQASCVIHVQPQADIAGQIAFKNIGGPPNSTREITVEAELLGIDYKHTKGAGVGACTTGAATNGTLQAKATITGENDGPTFTEHIGLFMS